MRYLRPLLPFFLTLLVGCTGAWKQTDQQLAKQRAAVAERYLARDTSRTIDLTNPALDVWDRIRRGFAIPNVNDELSQQWTQYYAAHPQSM